MRIKVLNTLLLCFFLWSCKPDEQIIIDDDPCFLPDIEYGINGPLVDYEAIQYLKPCFNPSNEDEIVYIEEQPTSGISHLCVLNIVDLTNTYIQDNVSGSPKWSKTGWIIFNKADDIWKIKPDGDSLTLLFSNGTNYSPEINPRGDKIIFKYQLDNYIAIKISDLNGNVIDSLEDQALFCPSWSPDGKKISMRRAGEPSSFGYYDTTLSLFTPIITNNSDTF
ncbi:MAG: PD40 domain-containing protein [Bacteroidetes bacterium]|nr:PD40 domain-containing protein [Bacteroidota bacterium]